MPTHRVGGKNVYFDAKMTKKEIQTAIAKKSKKSDGAMSKDSIKRTTETITQDLFEKLEKTISEDAIHTAIKEVKEVLTEALAAIERELKKPKPVHSNDDVLKAIKNLPDSRDVLTAISRIDTNSISSQLRVLQKSLGEGIPATETRGKSDENKITDFVVHPKDRKGKQKVELIRGVVH